MTLFLNPAQAAQVVNLGWQPSTEPNVAGYRVYYGTAGGQYTNMITVGNVTSTTIEGLASGTTYYFAATTINAQNQESSFSNEAIYQVPVEIVTNVPVGTLQIQSEADGQFRLTVIGPAGQMFVIEASTDFQSWAPIGTGTMAAEGWVDFIDTDAGNFPQRFYRIRWLEPSQAQVSAPSSNSPDPLAGKTWYADF